MSLRAGGSFFIPLSNRSYVDLGCSVDKAFLWALVSDLLLSKGSSIQLQKFECSSKLYQFESNLFKFGKLDWGKLHKNSFLLDYWYVLTLVKPDPESAEIEENEK